jgi:membrane associated rhomboid family serine protease
MPSPPPPTQGLGAGALLIATILVIAAIGFGIGTLFGAALELALAGAAIGFVGGVLLVIRAFQQR